MALYCFGISKEWALLRPLGTEGGRSKIFYSQGLTLSGGNNAGIIGVGSKEFWAGVIRGWTTGKRVGASKGGKNGGEGLTF